MNTHEHSQFHQLARQPDLLERRLGADGISFPLGEIPPWLEPAPLAVALCCSDMRELPERVLGSALGPIYAVQTGGGLVTPTTAASLRYALSTTGARLLVVLGHSECTLLKNCWLGGDVPPVLQHLVDRTFDEARRIPHCDPVRAIRSSVRQGAEAARRLVRTWPLAAEVSVVVGFYDENARTVTLSALPAGVRRESKPPPDGEPGHG